MFKNWGNHFFLKTQTNWNRFAYFFIVIYKNKTMLNLILLFINSKQFPLNIIN